MQNKTEEKRGKMYLCQTKEALIQRPSKRQKRLLYNYKGINLTKGYNICKYSFIQHSSTTYVNIHDQRTDSNTKIVKDFNSFSTMHRSSRQSINKETLHSNTYRRSFQNHRINILFKCT